MQRATIDALQALDSSHWFRSAGWLGSHKDENVVFLKNWPAAIMACSDPQWERVSRQTAMQMLELIGEASPELAAEWMNAMRDFQPITEDLVRRKTEQLVDKEALPSIFITTTTWTIQHFLMECEFSVVVPRGWYGALGAWILRGHFPCGWQGFWPDGKMVVF